MESILSLPEENVSHYDYMERDTQIENGILMTENLYYPLYETSSFQLSPNGTLGQQLHDPDSLMLSQRISQWSAALPNYDPILQDPMTTIGMSSQGGALAAIEYFAGYDPGLFQPTGCHVPGAYSVQGGRVTGSGSEHAVDVTVTAGAALLTLPGRNNFPLAQPLLANSYLATFCAQNWSQESPSHGLAKNDASANDSTPSLSVTGASSAQEEVAWNTPDLAPSHLLLPSKTVTSGNGKLLMDISPSGNYRMHCSNTDDSNPCGPIEVKAISKTRYNLPGSYFACRRTCSIQLKERYPNITVASICWVLDPRFQLPHLVKDDERLLKRNNYAVCTHHGRWPRR